MEKYAILSLAGEHAGETFKEIIKRKMKDIENTGYTFWVLNLKTGPNTVQSFNDYVNKEQVALNCLLYKGNTKNTKYGGIHKEYSSDKKNWQKIDERLSPITGKKKNTSHALVFDKLKPVKKKLNLENYVNYETKKPIQNSNFCSTFCAIKKYDNKEPKEQNKLREIFAIGRIHKPSSVWLR